MAVTNLQRRAPEIGRIRMGDSVVSSNGKTRPNRLSKWKLTSADRGTLEAAAALYGGTVQPWEKQPGQFQLYTEVDELPCIVAPQEVAQWYEEWSKGGCQKRCDGETAQVAQGEVFVVLPCQCDPENRECKLTTRLSVMLHQLPGLGTWRLESHGYYAATEMAAQAETLIGLAQQRRMIPTALAIEEKTVVRLGKTKNFPVPVFRVKHSLATLLTGEIPQALPEPTRALPAPASRPARQTVPQNRQESPASHGKAGKGHKPADAPPTATQAPRAGKQKSPSERCFEAYISAGGSPSPRATMAAHLGMILGDDSVSEKLQLGASEWERCADWLETEKRLPSAEEDIFANE